MWWSREGGIVVDIDILSCQPYNVEPMFEGFNGVACDLLGSWGDVGFGVVLYVF